jgi:hypothetical protein
VVEESEGGDIRIGEEGCETSIGSPVSDPDAEDAIDRVLALKKLVCRKEKV